MANIHRGDLSEPGLCGAPGGGPTEGERAGHLAAEERAAVEGHGGIVSHHGLNPLFFFFFLFSSFIFLFCFIQLGDVVDADSSVFTHFSLRDMLYVGTLGREV